MTRFASLSMVRSTILTFREGRHHLGLLGMMTTKALATSMADSNFVFMGNAMTTWLGLGFHREFALVVMRLDLDFMLHLASVLMMLDLDLVLHGGASTTMLALDLHRGLSASMTATMFLGNWDSRRTTNLLRAGGRGTTFFITLQGHSTSWGLDFVRMFKLYLATSMTLL